MHSRSVLSVASAALLALACSSSSPGGSGPVVSGVEPASGYASAPQAITIHGENFSVAAVQPSGGGDPVLKLPRVFLGTVELTPVQWIDNSTLKATVPQGMATGAYPVSVMDGHGATSAALASGYTVLSEGQLSAALSVERATVNVGGTFTVTLTLANNGSTEITNLAFGDPTVTGSAGGAATLSGPAPTPPASLAPGAQTTATWSFQATAAGRVTVSISATGKATGTTLTAVPPAPAAVTIQTPARLTATWTARTLQTTGQPVTVTLVLTNAAGAATANVTDVAPTSAPANPVATCGPVAPATSAAAPVSIAGGTFASFSWDCTAHVTTQIAYTFNATVAATDVNSGLPVTPTLNGVQVSYTPNPTLGVAVAGNGGVGSTVSSAPQGINACSSTGGNACSAQYAEGTVVTLTATPRAGATVAWTGCDAPNPTGTGNTCRVTISRTANNSVTATFTLQQFSVTVTPAAANGGTGTVTSNVPAGATVAPINACAVGAGGVVSGTCAGPFDFGTTVVLTASPGNAGTSVTWTNTATGQPGCNASDGGVIDAVAHTCTFANIQAAKPVTATFTLASPQLTVTPGGTGSGTIVSAPAGIANCSRTGGTCAAPFSFGTPVILTATPGAGSSVTWTGCDANADANTCSVTVNQVAGKAVTVNFTLATPSLTVTVNGTGSGTVASSPTGITGCTAAGGTSCAANFNFGTQVTLTASPAAGSTVVWGAGCTPSGNTCVVASVTQATAITATFQGTVATPTFSPAAGAYTTIQSVTLGDATPGAQIFYTTDGSVPTAASTPYTTPIQVAATTTVRAIATATGYTSSAVGSATYTINLVQAAAPTFSIGTGTYSTAQSVTLSSTTPGAQIRYTTDGSQPTAGSTLFAGAIPVNSSMTINAIAIAFGFANSSVSSATYTLQAATPTFSPVAGTYTSAQSVSIGSTTPGAQVFYTTDGSTPTTGSTPYAGAFAVAASATVRAIATATGFANSGIGSASYTINLPQTVTVTSVIDNTATGTVSVSAATGITACSPTGGTCSAAYAFGSSVTLTASGTFGSVAWTGCDSTTPPPTPAGATCTVAANSTRTITATFNP